MLPEKVANHTTSQQLLKGILHLPVTKEKGERQKKELKWPLPGLAHFFLA